MDDSRFTRLEDKVDRVDDKVDKISVNLAEMKVESRIQMDAIKDHIESDKAIVVHIQPILPILNDLAEMVQDHKYKKHKSKETMSKLKTWSMYTGAILGSVSVLTVIGKLIRKLFT